MDTRLPAQHVPEPPPGHIARPRLFDRLDDCVQAPLTFVSAAAGWGKTALLSSWTRSGRAPGPVVWWASDPREASTVWQRLAAAVNGLDSSGTPVIVVLDGLPTADVSHARASMDLLAPDRANRVHLVIAARADPSPVCGLPPQEAEPDRLGADQLAFSHSETAALFAAHRVPMTEAALTFLRGQTGGWPAALRLAAIYLRGHPEPARLVREFELHDRGLSDYLATELLGEVGSETRTVLSHTSVLDHLTPELVEALTGRGDGAQILFDLERSNLVRRHGRGPRPWYRHHPLVGQLLHDELRRNRPDLLPDIHRRAAHWYATHEMPSQALRHALAAGDRDLATAVIESSWHSLVPGARADRTTEAPMPPDTIRDDPRLALAFAAERLGTGDLPGCAIFLDLFDRSQQRLDNKVRGRLRFVASAVRASRAYQSGDPEQILSVDAPPSGHGCVPRGEDRKHARMIARLAAGTARLGHGDVAAAEPLLLNGLDLARQANLAGCEVAARRQLAVLNAVRGTLGAAARYAREAIDQMHAHLLTSLDDTVGVELALAEVCYQRDRISEAVRHLDRAVDAGPLDDPTPLGMPAIVQAHVHAAVGHPRAAAESLALARRQLPQGHVQPELEDALTIAEARLRLDSGDAPRARRLLDNGAASGWLSHWFALVRAEMDFAERRPSAAAGPLRTYLRSTPPWPVWTAEANLLLAAALAALGDRNGASQALQQALRAARPDEIIRPFMARGKVALDLLTSYLPDDVAHRRFADHLVARLVLPPGHGRSAPSRPPEPLTERERAVLRLLQSMMSTTEIASRLYVSANTVKTHMRNIYHKLGVGRRRDAIQRAFELHILEHRTADGHGQ